MLVKIRQLGTDDSVILENDPHTKRSNTNYAITEANRPTIFTHPCSIPSILSVPINVTCHTSNQSGYVCVPVIAAVMENDKIMDDRVRASEKGKRRDDPEQEAANAETRTPSKQLGKKAQGSKSTGG